MSERRESYRSLFDNAPEAIVIFDLESHAVLNASRLALELYGYKKKTDFLGRDFFSLQENPPRFSKHINELRSKGLISNFKVTQLKKDGSPRAVIINSSVVEYGEQQAVQCYIRAVKETTRVGRGPRRRKSSQEPQTTIDSRQVKKLAVIYSGYVLHSALKELLADQDIEVEFIRYPDNYDPESESIRSADFFVFAFSKLSEFEIEDLKGVCKERHCPVMVVSIDVDVDTVIALIKTGIRGVIVKDRDFALLPSAINAISKGEYWFPRAIMQRFFEGYQFTLNSGKTDSSGILSAREAEILKLIVKGLKNKEIASELGISYSTVLTHIYNIYRKLEVNSRAQAIRQALNSSLVEIG